MVKDLKEKVFPTRQIHYLAVNKSLPRTTAQRAMRRSEGAKQMRVS